jgi:glutamate synthase domain-containing protein 2
MHAPLSRYRRGLLKIMSKMGSEFSYRGGLNFEAVGLSRAMVAEYFPACSRAFRASACTVQQKLEEVHARAGWRRGRAAHRRLLQGAAVGRRNTPSADHAYAAIGLRQGVL